MSGKIVGMVFDHYDGRAAELLLAVKLADNAHDDGSRIFPAVATLARQTRQSERTVQYQLKRMLASGWLELVREAVGGGRGHGYGRPREYRIHPVFVKAHDIQTPESERPVWPPQKQQLRNPEDNETGAESAPISLAANVDKSDKWVQPGKEMGAIAVAEMGAIAVAPYPPLTVRIQNTPLPPIGGGAPDFSAVFAEYPRQVDEAKARRQWDKLQPDDATRREILAAIRQWRASAEWQREEGRYVPKLANWLSHCRWRDVPGFALTQAPAAQPQPLPALPSAPMPQSVRQHAQQILKSAGLRKKLVEAA